ncbi:HAD family phosphatase [candidate division KSB1 bacterium]|nr:HAD family phosphatase [candidate division KSB1 bacterium]NIR71150.1 HAD family phosphatase [candidate division KSB1 bacterium]NIS23280.1 HAD family phosphatase [candidate division KSB1 bacterium]NIT70158.1 HAD family phosphatase [candidate division KSB1 bacterium]NIU23810.1 HAD family phosphatase [candidate division KSB1 bacterium]
MIKAIIFDLDGTLVQTERLKAISYAQAAVELRPEDLDEEAVVRAFKDVVGLSRHEVAQALMQRFELEDAARARMSEFDVNQPWQAYVQIRLRIYDEMSTDPQILQEHACPYNIGLLHDARERGLLTGLATMSYCAQVNRVLRILDLKDEFDFVASRDDVETGKPDPEIYQLVAKQLNVKPEACLVIEDSSSGVKAALAADMQCIVVTTDFTRKAIHSSDVIDKRWVVDDPSELLSVAKQVMD